MNTVDRQEILELLGQGKISAEEAANLLAQSKASEAFSEPALPVPAVEKTAESTIPPASPSWLRVRVRNMETGQNKVSVNIPVRMFKFGLKLGKHFTSELEDLDWKEINQMVTEMQPGVLVEVQDEEKNEHVQVYLE